LHQSADENLYKLVHVSL